MQQFYKSSIICLQIILLYSFDVSAQDIIWEKSYGGKHAEYLFDAIPTPDYGFILAGSSISNKNGNKSDNNKGDLDYWVWKMNEKGDLEWQKSFGGSGIDFLKNVQLTNDGGFILAGTSTSDKSFDKKEDSKGDADLWIIKLDAKGNEMWQKTIGGSEQEKVQSIVQLPDGGYIIGGSSSSNKVEIKENTKENMYTKSENSRGGLDFWIVKLKENGEIEWQKTIGGRYDDELKSIVNVKNDGYLLGGYSNSPISGEKSEDNFGNGDYWIVKINQSGDIQWQKNIGGELDDSLNTIIQTKDGNFILGGSSNSSSSNSKTKASLNGTDFWVVKIDNEGQILWEETYNFGKVDILSSIVENEDKSLLIGGYSKTEIENTGEESILKKNKSDKVGINDYIALKVNPQGEEIWNKTVGSKGEEVLKTVVETRDGGYLFAGTSKGESSRDKNSNIGNCDFWIVKVKDKTKTEKPKINIEAYPNPAGNYTNIIVNFEYNNGTATLYDLNGRQLRQFEITGERTIPIELNNLPQGIYLVNIKTDTNQEAVKIIKE